MVLNGAQRCSLEGWFEVLASDWRDVLDKHLPLLWDTLQRIAKASEAADASNNPEEGLVLPQVERTKLFEAEDHLEAVEQLLRVLRHPRPQNRAASDEYSDMGDAKFAYWRDPDGQLVKEEVGLLSLTNLNDPPGRATADGNGSQAVPDVHYLSDSRVTRLDVLSFIQDRLAAVLCVLAARRVRHLEDEISKLKCSGYAPEPSEIAVELQVALQENSRLLQTVDDLKQENEKLRAMVGNQAKPVGVAKPPLSPVKNGAKKPGSRSTAFRPPSREGIDRGELESLWLADLQKQAAAVGATREEVDNASSADDPKKKVIDLILSKDATGRSHNANRRPATEPPLVRSGISGLLDEVLGPEMERVGSLSSVPEGSEAPVLDKVITSSSWDDDDDDCKKKCPNLEREMSEPCGFQRVTRPFTAPANLQPSVVRSGISGILDDVLGTEGRDDS